MSPDILQALGWTWCAIGFALHMRGAPVAVFRRTLPAQPLTVTLVREGADGIKATGKLELSPRVERLTVIEALEQLRRQL